MYIEGDKVSVRVHASTSLTIVSFHGLRLPKQAPIWPQLGEDFWRLACIVNASTERSYSIKQNRGEGACRLLILAGIHRKTNEGFIVRREVKLVMSNLTS